MIKILKFHLYLASFVIDTFLDNYFPRSNSSHSYNIGLYADL